MRDHLGGPLSWDQAFLAVAVLLVAGGWLLHTRGLRALERDAIRATDNHPEVGGAEHAGGTRFEG